ncbi:LOW QUALITY PROTEIN: hypothetical protein PanWU01x14_327530, partial [Parasponia andersonii]
NIFESKEFAKIKKTTVISGLIQFL